jgi:hypothetical protein
VLFACTLIWILVTGFLNESNRLTVASSQEQTVESSLDNNISPAADLLEPKNSLSIQNICISIVKNGITWLEITRVVCLRDSPELSRYIHVLRDIRYTVLKVTIFMSLSSTIFYGVSKNYFDCGSHAAAYRWTYSAAYLTSTPAAATLLSIFAVTIIYILFSFLRLESQLMATDSSPDLPAPPHLARHQTKNRENTHISYPMILLFGLVNNAFIIAVKCLYVYATLSGSVPARLKLVLKIMLSIFDVVWSNIVLTKAITMLYFMRSKVRIRLHLALLVFNSIFAPVIASALTDDNCFLQLFTGTETAHSSSTYTYCSRLSPAIDSTTPSACLETGVLTLHTEYKPPVMYQYQCTSSILSNFVPVLLLSYTGLAFVLPVLIFFLSYLSTSTLTFRRYMHRLPGIFWPTHLKDVPNHRIMHPGVVIAALLGHIVVLVTFGLASPPLALAICITVWVTSLQWELLIGRYIQYAQMLIVNTGDACPSPSPIQFMEDTFHGAWLGPAQSVWTIADFGCVFVTFLILDISGDEDGILTALINIGLPAILLPFLMRFIVRRYWWAPVELCRRSDRRTDTDAENGSDTVGINLSESPKRNSDKIIELNMQPFPFALHS